MADFKYKARDKFGRSVSGVVSGADKQAVAASLGAMGYVPISIAEAEESNDPISKFLARFDKVKEADLIMFTRQLLSLQKAGVTLLSNLDTIEKQTKNKFFRSIIKDVASNVERGVSFSDALSKYPQVFNEFYVNMIRAAEASGQMDEIMERLVQFTEKELDTKNKIKAAVRYPIITLCALAGAFFVVVTFVIPKFATIFAQFKTGLPLPTKILMGMSVAMRKYWYILAVVGGAIAFLFNRYINTKGGRYRWDSFQLKAPIFGEPMTMLVISRFTRTMSILIRSGLPILQVLDMASKTASNAVISRAVDNIIVSVKEGKGISEPMRISGAFPPLVVNMVAIGESSGKVDELMMNISQYYDQEADYIIQNLSTIMEPVFVVVLGAMVLTMALAIFLPMWNLISLFQH
ncbi:MAG: type II secretion system F family protein [Candidatus Omnitrophota bacterium]